MHITVMFPWRIWRTDMAQGVTIEYAAFRAKPLASYPSVPWSMLVESHGVKDGQGSVRQNACHFLSSGINTSQMTWHMSYCSAPNQFINPDWAAQPHTMALLMPVQVVSIRCWASQAAVEGSWLAKCGLAFRIIAVIFIIYRLSGRAAVTLPPDLLWPLNAYFAFPDWSLMGIGGIAALSWISLCSRATTATAWAISGS